MQSNIKILISDDVLEMRGILRKMLYDYGYLNVECVANGEEVMHKFKSGDFHMVMLDISMPLKDGVQVLKEIRGIDTKVFVVMVSADSSVEMLKTTLDLGANGFIVKPCSSAKFKGIMQKFNAYLLESGHVSAGSSETKTLL